MRKSHSSKAKRPRTIRSGDAVSAARALRDANQRLQSILIANEVATWTWDVVNDRVVPDENMNRLFGVNSKDPLGEPVERYLQVIHPDDRPAVAAAIQTVLEGPHDKFAMDYRLIREDGAISWVTARGKVERDAYGKPTFFPGVVVDITERKLSEQKAEELRFRLEQQSRILDITLSSISDFAYIFDRSGRFIFINQALLDLWGLKLQEATGKNFYDLKYPDELAERLQRQIQQVFDTGEGLTDEAPYTSETGAGGYYEYIFRPVFDRNGAVELVAGSTRDITERKRIEAQLRQSEERHRALAETLENMVATRTRELEERNSDVLLQSEMLRKLSVRLMETQDEESRRIARELHDSAGQIVAALSMNLGRMLMELKNADPKLLQLAQETRRYAEELDRELRTTSYLLHPPMLDEIGLRAALAWYVDGLKQRAGLEVELNIDGALERPSRDRELAVFRIVQECLTNIHRHSGSKSAHIKIARQGADILVEVRDAGRGIPEDQLKRIQAKATGVGLRGIRERVRQFAGELSIESQVGVGTTIRVRLLLRDPA
jgi:PAS domain S-box-containing protein